VRSGLRQTEGFTSYAGTRVRRAHAGHGVPPPRLPLGDVGGRALIGSWALQGEHEMGHLSLRLCQEEEETCHPFG